MKKKSKLKKVIIIIGIVVISIILFYANQFFGGKQGAIEVTTGKVELGPFEQTVQATGILEPADKIKVRAEVEGNIREKRVKDGDRVKKGDILLEIDQEKLKTEVLNAEIKLRRLQNNLKNLVENSGPYEAAQSQNNLEKVKIAVEYAEKNVATMQRLFSQEVVTRRQLEEAERSYESAKLDYAVSKQQIGFQKEKFDKEVQEMNGEIQIAEADLKEVKRRYNLAIIKAPIAGSIVEDILKEKKYVGFGEEVFAIGDLSQFNAKVKVDELDISKVKLGQPASISSDAFKEAKLPGQVIEIAAQATRQTFAEVEVTIKVDSTLGQPVRPNLSVDADIQTYKMDTALKVPVEAVVKQEEKQYVFVVNGDRVKKKEVTVGLSSPKFRVIEQGVKSGDTIVLQNANKLKDNDRIKIKPEKKKKK
ncbi:MAG: efflux RND transporter periplasmic adaptor subunit [bacterium]|nr:efflux RND transporter periplasmic adaptor subunit [bacterium]